MISVYVKLLTDRQTDRQTNAGHYITSWAEVMKLSNSFVTLNVGSFCCDENRAAAVVNKFV